MKRQIYVLRSKDETITKIGCSQMVSYRVDNIISSERKMYYLVYLSDFMDGYEATTIEAEIIKHFSSDCIKGREWLKTHPLKVVQYITFLIGEPKGKEGISMEDIGAKYPVWLVDNKTYRNCSFEQQNKVRINKYYEGFVKFLYCGQMITLGFANLYDANKFASDYKHNITSCEHITKLLYGLDYSEWIKQRTTQGNSYKKQIFI